LYRICLLTGDDGRDASSLYNDPRLLGHFFAAPYGLFEPALAFVAEDTAGVGGYILGALDTQAFEERLERTWWPHLRARYPDPPASVPGEQLTPDQQVVSTVTLLSRGAGHVIDRGLAWFCSTSWCPSLWW
jgi:hypothetical protein